MVTEPNSGASAPPNEPAQQPPSAEPANTEPKFEMKDGAMFVDGKKVTYESDLIAAKKSLQDANERAQTVHNEAIDKAKLDLSGVQSQLAAANARVQELETAQKNAVAVSPEDTAKQNQALKNAQDNAAKVAQDALDLRIKNIMLQYPGQVTEEQLKSRTPEQLTAFEDALKAISTSRGGPGPYALPGGGGGTGPMSEMDRAKALIEATPVRGTRTQDTK